MRLALLFKLLTFVIIAHLLFLIIIYFTTQHRLNRPADNKKLKTQEIGNNAYYFAYGANMSEKYLTNIRNIVPISTTPATLSGYALTFNLKGRNFLEPGFANISTSEHNNVEGVIHEVSQKDLEKLLKSEPSEYKIIDADVLVEGKNVSAKTLIYNGESLQLYKPSKRYLGLLTNAAIEHGLSKEYISKLQSTEYIYYPLLSEGYGAIIYFYLMTVTSSK